jgi:hypothetical protein
VPTSTYAQQLLDLTSEQADELFNGSNTREDLERIVEEVTQAA